MKDSASFLLPATRQQVLHALGKLSCAPLLNCFRGCRPADLKDTADIILAVAEMVEKDPSAINELDINPRMVLAKGQGFYPPATALCGANRNNSVSGWKKN